MPFLQSKHDSVSPKCASDASVLAGVLAFFLSSVTSRSESKEVTGSHAMFASSLMKSANAQNDG